MGRVQIKLKYLDKAKEDVEYSTSERANGFSSLIIRNKNKNVVLLNAILFFNGYIIS
jgi:hypothetical protein